MSEPVSQWLDEVKSLQKKLAGMETELEGAHASAARWRELYNREAEQRRLEVKQLQQKIELLQGEIGRLKAVEPLSGKEAAVLEALQQELEIMGATEELKAKLLDFIRTGDRLQEEVASLREAVAAERAAHEQTRKGLTAALGDTVELLKKAQTPPKRPSPSLPQTYQPGAGAENLLAPFQSNQEGSN